MPRLTRIITYATSWKYISKYADDYSPRASMPILSKWRRMASSKSLAELEPYHWRQTYPRRSSRRNLLRFPIEHLGVLENPKRLDITITIGGGRMPEVYLISTLILIKRSRFGQYHVSLLDEQLLQPILRASGLLYFRKPCIICP